MQQITFDIPHCVGPKASSEARLTCDKFLQTCLRTIAKGSAKTVSRPSYSVGPGQTQVTFDLYGVFEEDSLPLNNAVALQALLRCLTAINIDFLRRFGGKYPDLYNSGVRYDRTQVWDSYPALYARGYGDCKSLSCARIADLLVRGGVLTHLVFRWIKTDNGITNYHILVQNGNSYEDPSKVCGMGKDENAYFARTG